MSAPPPRSFPPASRGRQWILNALLVAGVPLLAPSQAWPCCAAGWLGYWDTQGWLVALTVLWWIELISHSQLLVFRDLFHFPTLPTSSNWGPDAFNRHRLQCKGLQKSSRNLMPRPDYIGSPCSFWVSMWLLKVQVNIWCFSFQHRMKHCFGDREASMNIYFKGCKSVHTFWRQFGSIYQDENADTLDRRISVKAFMSKIY